MTPFDGLIGDGIVEAAAAPLVLNEDTARSPPVPPLPPAPPVPPVPELCGLPARWTGGLTNGNSSSESRQWYCDSSFSCCCGSRYVIERVREVNR